jgi:ribonuclease-3
MTDRRNLEGLEEILGHRFSDIDLLRLALTHRSTAQGRGDHGYERLEFLGDRVLGLVVSHMLYERYAEEPEGKLSVRQAALVRKETLAELAAGLGLGAFIILSAGEEESGTRESPSVLADITEALIGALYLDGGLAPAAAFVEKHWAGPMAAHRTPPRDAKTRLQEWALARGLPLPSYRMLSQEGPAHEPAITVELVVKGQEPVNATAGSKRAAQQQAAEALLERLEAVP